MPSQLQGKSQGFLLCGHIYLLLFSGSWIFTFAFLDSLELNYPSNSKQLKTISDLIERGYLPSSLYLCFPPSVLLQCANKASRLQK